MKAMIVSALLAASVGSVANAGFFSTDKTRACMARMTPIMRMQYKCEFGKMVPIGERNGNSGGNGGHGCNHGGGHGGGRN